MEFACYCFAETPLWEYIHVNYNTKINAFSYRNLALFSATKIEMIYVMSCYWAKEEVIWSYTVSRSDLFFAIPSTKK